MSHIYQLPLEEGTHLGCVPCIQANKRGRIARFKNTQTADARSWINRHKKHGEEKPE